MKKRLVVLCLMLGIVCAGCANEDVSDNSSIKIEEEVVEENTEESIQEDEYEKVEETEKTEESEDAEEVEKEKFNLFAEMKNREFYFSSGAGGWRTIMHIDKDGSFTGEYSDSDMGSIGDGYPNGTYYVCSFKGEFTKPVKVNEYTYSVGIAGIEFEKEPGTEEIIDGILHCYSTPYGIEGTNSLLFYLPEAPLEELPQEYLDWVRYDIAEAEDGKLSFYGIYNEKEQNGFSSYEILNPIDELMAQTKDAAEVLRTSIEKDVLTQTEMNMKSQELYELWDGVLNKLWAELKSTLPKDEFETVLNEQRAWITEKESAVEKAGAEVEGGSLAPLVRNLEAADLTEKRVYELYELLK